MFRELGKNHLQLQTLTKTMQHLVYLKKMQDEDFSTENYQRTGGQTHGSSNNKTLLNRSFAETLNTANVKSENCEPEYVYCFLN